MADFTNKGSFSYGGVSFFPSGKFVETGNATNGIDITDFFERYQAIPHVTDILISSSGIANTFTVTDSLGGGTEFKVYVAANSQFIYSPRSEIPLPTGDALRLTAAVAGNVSVKTYTYWV